MTKSPIKIATAQSFISKDVRANGLEIRTLMTQAHEQGASLINFPEGALSGYVGAEIMDWQEVNWDILREELNLIARLASDISLWVAVGCNHRLADPYRPHNSIYIISDKGEIHSRYDKQWCSNNETLNWYTPGQGLCIFEVNGWRFGCAICIEIQFPELFLAYGSEQIDCLLYSVYSDDAMFGIQAQGHSATNNFWFSFSNASQKSETLPSRLIGPSGVIQCQVESNKSTLCVNTLDPAAPEYEVALKYARPWRAIARNTDFYKSRLVQNDHDE